MVGRWSQESARGIRKNYDLGNFYEASLRVGVFHIGSAESTKNELQRNQPHQIALSVYKECCRWISVLTPWRSQCLPSVYDLDFMPDLSTRGQTFIYGASHHNSMGWSGAGAGVDFTSF